MNMNIRIFYFCLAKFYFVIPHSSDSTSKNKNLILLY